MSVREELRALAWPVAVLVVAAAVLTLLARVVAVVVVLAADGVQRAVGIAADVVEAVEDALSTRCGMRVPLGARLVVLAGGERRKS